MGGSRHLALQKSLQLGHIHRLSGFNHSDGAKTRTSATAGCVQNYSQKFFAKLCFNMEQHGVAMEI